MKLKVENKYLILPLGYFATKKKLEFYVNGKLRFDIDAAIDFIEPDYFQFLNIERFAGQELDIICRECDVTYLETTDYQPEEGLYKEKYRPRVHFSAKRGWINDPNGLVYYKGYYHLFFQHNPAGTKWGNMHWGHAVSKDLVHWNEKECALYPDELGTMFSGSAIVDWDNVTGLKENENDVILLFYTAAGGTSKLSEKAKFTQCMAYSTDGGTTFVKYPANPVIPHIEGENRDPKVIYSPELKAYIMALYMNDNRYLLFRSKNLLDWVRMHEVTLPGDSECPDFYPLPLDGDRKNFKWVFSGASDRYLVGDMINGSFLPSQPHKRLHYGKNSYAAQTFSDIPKEDGRRIRIAWNTMELPNSYFNCSMCFPTEMSLKTINGEMFLCAWPVREIEKLYKETTTCSEEYIGGEKYFSRKLAGKAFDVEMDISCQGDSDFSISLFGMVMECKTGENQLQFLNNTMPLYINEGKIKLRIIVDVNGVEIFVDKGQAYMCTGFLCDYNLDSIKIAAARGNIHINNMRISSLEKRA